MTPVLSKVRRSLHAVPDSIILTPPVRPLSAREGGRDDLDDLHEGVPAHLAAPLRSWTRRFVTAELTKRLALRLRLHDKLAGGLVLLAAIADDAEPGPLIDALLTDALLLDAVDLSLQLDRTLHREIADLALMESHPPGVVTLDYELERIAAVKRLEELLADAGSAYQVHWWPTPVLLVRRVDATAAASFEHACGTASKAGAQLLREAWRQVYCRDPDPTAGYATAVRAVEEVLCPLVLPRDPLRTLGKALGELRKIADRWSFVLLGKDGIGDIAPLVAVVARLWEGQRARHGGGPNGFQPQTQAEAEAAVHLAATVVQWISAGALTRRDAPETDTGAVGP